MANSKHLDIIKRGVDEWNRWRTDNPEIIPDLAWANLSGLNLKGINLSKANMKLAFCISCNFEGSDFSKSNLYGINLQNSVLSNSNMAEANLEGANLINSLLEGANLYGVNFKLASLNDSNLKHSNLLNVHKLTVEQLLSAANIENAQIEPNLLQQLKKIELNRFKGKK